MRYLMLGMILLGLGLSGHARADDAKSASTVLAQHGFAAHSQLAASTQLAQATGCANVCQLPESNGAKSCDLAGAGGTTCIPVGSGCTCSGQVVGGMGLVGGIAGRK